jgi:hypothetical protein
MTYFRSVTLAWVILNALPSKTMALFLILTFLMFINLNYIIINTNKKINL